MEKKKKKKKKELTEELHKRELNDLDNHNGVVTHLEPDILECEVKWALEGTAAYEASGADGFPAESFKILKDDSIKVLHSVCQQTWKNQQQPHDWKRSQSSSQFPRRAVLNNCNV